MKNVLVIHGPNLNLLGTRETNIYGAKTLDDINSELIELANKNYIKLNIFFSNHEGDIINFIQNNAKDANALIINPAAYTHTSIAIRDAILAYDLIMIEVHLSNIYKREGFRQKSYFHDIAKGVIMGLGSDGYFLALRHLITLL